MTDAFFQISLALFTASITAASLTFIATAQVMVWVSTIEKRDIQDYQKLNFDYLRTPITLFLLSNVLVIVYWFLLSLGLDFIIGISLVIFFIAILFLFQGLRKLTRRMFFWRNTWQKRTTLTYESYIKKS